MDLPRIPFPLPDYPAMPGAAVIGGHVGFGPFSVEKIANGFLVRAETVVDAPAPAQEDGGWSDSLPGGYGYLADASAVKA